MDTIEKIELLLSNSSALYQDCANERFFLHQEEFEMAESPLGEMEEFCTFIAAIATSILNNKVPVAKLDLLKNSTVQNAIPSVKVINKYNSIVKYILLYNQLRLQCITYIEMNDSNL